MPNKIVTCVAAFAATFSCFALPAEYDFLIERLNSVESQIETHAQLQTGMNQLLIELQKEVKELRGIVEEHQFKLKQIEDRQRDLYRDIENRFNALKDSQPSEDSPPSAATKPAVKSQAAPSKQPTAKPVKSSPSEHEAFNNAFQLVRSKDYQQAVTEFEAFLKTYPQGAYAANSRFWMGQIYFVQSQFDQAAEQFELLRKNFADSPKLAAATLKLADIKMQKQQWQAAQTLYQEILDKHTGDQYQTTRQAAQQGLDKIKDAGH